MSKTLKLPVLGVKIDVSKPSWFRWLKIRRRQDWKEESYYLGQSTAMEKMLSVAHTHSLPLDEEVIKLKRLTALMAADMAHLESFALAFAEVGSLEELAKIGKKAKPEPEPEAEADPDPNHIQDHFDAAGSRLKLQKQHLLYSSPKKALRFMADYANWAMERKTKYGSLTLDKQAAFSMETLLVQAFFKQRYPKSSDRTLRRTVRGYSHTLRQLKILKPIVIPLPGKNPQSIDMLIYCHPRKVRKWGAESIQAESVRRFEQNGINKFDNAGGFQA